MLFNSARCVCECDCVTRWSDGHRCVKNTAHRTLTSQVHVKRASDKISLMENNESQARNCSRRNYNCYAHPPPLRCKYTLPAEVNKFCESSIIIYILCTSDIAFARHHFLALYLFTLVVGATAIKSRKVDLIQMQLTH